MPSTEDDTNARIHPARNDSDRGAAASSRPRWCPYAKSSPSSSCACTGRCWYEAEREEAEREAETRHESVDGVHPRKARKKT